MRSAVKNRVHAILAKHGIANEHCDLFGKGGREVFDRLELRDASRRRLDSLTSLICALHRDADHRRGRRHHPLPTARHLCSWAGLAPSVRSSDGKARLGPITRRAALGAGRSRAQDHDRIRTPARQVRADRQTPRTQDREGRGRPREPPDLHEQRTPTTARPSQPPQAPTQTPADPCPPPGARPSRPRPPTPQRTPGQSPETPSPTGQSDHHRQQPAPEGKTANPALHG